MNLFSLVGMEAKKLRRSGILLILLAAAAILWIPSIMNARLNFDMLAEGISPENNFLIQGFLGIAWFMFPASMVVGTVLLVQTERGNHGILKMLALPVPAWKLCIAKYILLLLLAMVQIALSVILYYISAGIASWTQHYDFLLAPGFVFREAGLLYLSAVPMIAFFWTLSVCIQTPVFSIGIGLASIVPSVLIINTKAWFLYPMCYPFYVITSEYSFAASGLSDFQVDLFPWLPTAGALTLICFIISCLSFGRAERR